jgi:hypothetical protein
MNDKEFEELAQGLFGLDVETLQEKFTEDEKREFAFKIADKALESVGFERTLIVARGGGELGVLTSGNPIAAAHLILTALENTPEETLEHVLLHLNSKKVKK